LQLKWTLLFVVICSAGNANLSIADSAEEKRIEFLIKSIAGIKVELNQIEDKRSYALGQNIAEYMNKQFDDKKNAELKIDKRMMAKGFVDGLNKKGLLTSGQVESLMRELNEEIQRIEKIAKQKASAESKKHSDAFTKSIKASESFVTTSTGLQYRVLRQGSGSRPGHNDTVVVHYKGTLVDGTEFDSSYNRNEPMKFKPTQVIAGWKEALMLMKKGGHWQVIIPPQLGYGEKGTGVIPGNAVLIFEIELIDIE